VQAGSSKNQVLSDILIPGNDWELVGEGYAFTEGTAVNRAGEFFFQDIPNSKTYTLGNNGKPVLLLNDSKKGSGTCFGTDGKRYVVSGNKQILSYDINGKEAVVANDLQGNDLLVANNGNLYITAPDGRENPGKIYLIKPDGKRILVDEGIKYPNGIALTPDQTQMYITESTSHWVWIFNIQPDGSLTNKQRYGWLHVRDTDDNAWSDGLKCDRDGRVYIATRLGIQVLDQIGRVNAIIPVPGPEPSNLCFAGPDFDELYISCRDKIYKRKLNVKGANAFDKPLKPANPKL
jgi:sugar lactone lactonase YvrE